MQKHEFQHIKSLIANYMATLSLSEVKLELANKGLLTRNMKLMKGEKLNHGLEMIPSVLSGQNLCEGAGACKYSCLAFSGVINVLRSKKILTDEALSDAIKMKARKTFVFLNDRAWFNALLRSEIEHTASKATLVGADCYFRLNVTTDIDWSAFVAEMPHIQFYDYTKVWTRQSTLNHHLTFSASELTPISLILQKVAMGENVAMVFAANSLPESYEGFRVIDGDVSDDRSSDPKGVIVGLRLKATQGGKDMDSTFAFKAVA